MVFLQKNPKAFKNAKLIKKISNLEKETKNISIKGVNKFGSGGMDTKIEAAKICNLAGCNMIIANGLYLNPINQIEKNNCTWFISKIPKLDARKNGLLAPFLPKENLLLTMVLKKLL